MGTAVRIVAFLVFVAGVAGATYGAYQAFPPDTEFTPVKLSTVTEGGITVLAGDTTPLDLQAQNLGNANVTMALQAEEEGFTFQAGEQPVRLGPAATQTISGTLQVPGDLSGDHEVVIEARNPETDRKLGSVSVDIHVVPEGEIVIGAVLDDFRVAPGGQYAVPVTIVSNLASNATVEVTGDHVVDHTFGIVQARALTGGFVTLTAPDDLSSEQAVGVTVTVGEASKELAATVAPPDEDGPVAGTEHTATTDYVGRLTDGRVFDTSVAEVSAGPFPTSATFQARPNPQPIQTPLDPSAARVIPGFRDAVIGMQPGETKTVSIPPDQAYGAARIHENISATTELPREEEVPRFLEDFPRAQLPAAFQIDTREEGDLINYTTDSGGATLTFKFRLVEKTNDTVTLERMERPGDTTTFYPVWPNATEVADVTEETIVFRTTPPQTNGTFTWDVNPSSHAAQWGEVTTVQSVNETTIVLHHAPDEGTAYQMASRPGAPPQTYTIEAVTEGNVHVSAPNPSPLGGQTLIFDITLVDLTESQAQGQP